MRLFKHFGNYAYRIRVHEGTQEDNLQGLAGYGIDRSEIPLDENGNLRHANHQEWIRKRVLIEEAQNKKQRERSEARRVAAEVQLKKSLGHLDSDAAHENEDEAEREVNLIIHPSKKDILMGRGKHARFHPGNIRLRVILERFLEEYDASQNVSKGKKEVAGNVLKELEESGARILEPVEGGVWKVADSKKAMAKLQHDFRTLRSSLRKAEGPTKSKKRSAEENQKG